MICGDDCMCIDGKSLLDLFVEKKCVTVCAPMVRYSKLPFRLLVRKYKCDIAFTPMIISSSFLESEKARQMEFTTSPNDRPLIVQFAPKDGSDLANATELVYPYSDGVDINCGCPQRWAIAEGYGASLLKKPENVRDMILQVKNRISSSKYTISLKIRLLNDIGKTLEFCRRAEQAGISWITVHGRTKDQRKELVDLDAIRLIKETLSIPVVANGDVFHLSDVKKVQDLTSVDGVMSARGLLQNPTLFCGTDFTPAYCIQDWIDVCVAYGSNFKFVHRHLMNMLEKVMPRHERKIFNSLTSFSSMLDHLKL